MRKIKYQILFIITVLFLSAIPLTPAALDTNYQTNKSFQSNILSTNSVERIDNTLVYKFEKYFKPPQSDDYDSTINPRNRIYFHGESNDSIYIVKVTSPNMIFLNNASFMVEKYAIGTQNTSFAHYDGCYFTNTTGFSTFMGSFGSERFREGSLRYERYKLGKFIDYTFENRSVDTVTDELVNWVWMNHPWNITFDPGTWYFIFSGVVFDLDEDDVTTHWSVWMNFSDECSDIDISTYEGGNVYGLWYGEFDANAIVSKAHTSEFMFNGKAQFHIDNNFLFDFVTNPREKGFWNIRWRTPEGLKKFNMIMNKNGWHYDEDNVDGCVYGLGGPGDYYLRTSYFDYDPDEGCAFPPYFIGLDIEFR